MAGGGITMTVKEFFETLLTGRIYDVEIYNINTDEEYTGTTETIAESDMLDCEIINWDIYRNSFNMTVC